MSGPIMKDGECLSATYLGWQRRQRCFCCIAPAPSEAHHAPPKGRGATNDILTIAVCRLCHQRMHGIDVVVDGVKMPAVPEFLQPAMVERQWFTFLKTATPEEWVQVARDIGRWKEGRVFGSLVPM